MELGEKKAGVRDLPIPPSVSSSGPSVDRAQASNPYDRVNESAHGPQHVQTVFSSWHNKSSFVDNYVHVECIREAQKNDKFRKNDSDFQRLSPNDSKRQKLNELIELKSSEPRVGGSNPSGCTRLRFQTWDAPERGLF